MSNYIAMAANKKTTQLKYHREGTLGMAESTNTAERVAALIYRSIPFAKWTQNQ